MLTCKEATLEIERMKFEKPTVFKKLAVGMHLMMCKACFNYKKDSAAIDELLKEKVRKEDEFTDDEMNSLINQLP